MTASWGSGGHGEEGKAPAGRARCSSQLGESDPGNWSEGCRNDLASKAGRGGLVPALLSSHGEDARHISARTWGKSWCPDGSPAPAAANPAVCPGYSVCAEPVILAAGVLLLSLLLKPLQRAVCFQEPGSSRLPRGFQPARGGFAAGDAVPLPCQLDWSRVSSCFFDILYKGLFLVTFSVVK